MDDETLKVMPERVWVERDDDALRDGGDLYAWQHPDAHWPDVAEYIRADEVTCLRAELAQARAELEEARSRSERAVAALREVFDPPLILADDDARAVAGWFVERAGRAVALLAAPTAAHPDEEG